MGPSVAKTFYLCSELYGSCYLLLLSDEGHASGQNQHDWGLIYVLDWVDVQEYSFPRSNIRVIVTDQAEEILASKGVSLAEEKCMQARFFGLSRTLGQVWIFYEKPVNFSRRVLLKWKNSSQKMRVKSDTFWEGFTNWEAFPTWDEFPSWEAFPAQNNKEKLFPEAKQQGNFSRRQSSGILWNIHPCIGYIEKYCWGASCAISHLKEETHAAFWNRMI
jgi:hypothetical protein